MKKNVLKITFSLFVTLWMTSMALAQFDDVYYDPTVDDDYVVYSENYDDDYDDDYDDEYGEEQSVIVNNYYNDGYYYTRRINRFYRPRYRQGFNLNVVFDPFFNPFTWQSGLFIGFGNGYYNPYSYISYQRPWYGYRRGFRNIYNTYNYYGGYPGYGSIYNTNNYYGGYGYNSGYGAGYCPPGYYGSTRTRTSGYTRTNATTRTRTVVSSPRRGTINKQPNRIKLRTGQRISSDDGRAGGKRVYGTNTTTKRKKTTTRKSNDVRKNTARESYKHLRPVDRTRSDRGQRSSKSYNDASSKRSSKRSSEAVPSRRSSKSYRSHGSNDHRPSRSYKAPRSNNRSSYRAPRSSARPSARSSRSSSPRSSGRSFRSSKRGR